MTYYVKKCLSCGHINHPAEVLCSACQTMLPANKVASETQPPRASTDAINTLRGSKRPSDASMLAEEELRASEQCAGPQTATHKHATPTNQGPAIVIVKGFDIPFIPLVWLCTKIILAALPAAILSIVILFFLFAAMGGIGAMLGVSR